MHKKLGRSTASGRGGDRTGPWGRLPVSQSVHHLRTVRPSSPRQGLGRNSQPCPGPLQASLWPPQAGKEEEQRCRLRRPRWPRSGDSNTRERMPCGRPPRLPPSPAGRTCLEEAGSCHVRRGAQKLRHRSLWRREVNRRWPCYSSLPAARAAVPREDPGVPAQTEWTAVPAGPQQPAWTQAR